MNVAIISGHPNSSSYCTALAKSYEEGSKSTGNKVRFISVTSMKFDAVHQRKTVEKDVAYAQSTLQWADHIVFIFPIWWGNMPALMKGFVDRVFASGVTYKFKEGGMWDKLLKGKSARVIATMDAPPLVYKLFFRNPLKKNMKAILGFCGVAPIKYSYIGSVKMASPEKRKFWLERIKKVGMKD